MLLTKTVEIKWTNKIKKHYVDKGYEFTKIGDSFKVRVEDLTNGSHATVEVQCDYCKKIVKKSYRDYLRQHNNSIIKKDCCLGCVKIKSSESNMIKYGVKNVFQVKEYQEKQKRTLMERYGVENTSQLDSYKEKFKETSRQRYGTDHPFQSEEVKQKIIETNIKRYGVEYSIQHPKIKEKAIKSLYKNGTAPTSSQQLQIYNMLKENNYNVEINYPVSNVNLDVAFFMDNFKIAIEYDGWYWHKNRQIEDRRRDEFLKKLGWKILRVKSYREVPTLEQVLSAINKLILTNRSYTEIIMDDIKLRNDAK